MTTEASGDGRRDVCFVCGQQIPVEQGWISTTEGGERKVRHAGCFPGATRRKMPVRPLRVIAGDMAGAIERLAVATVTGHGGEEAASLDLDRLVAEWLLTRIAGRLERKGLAVKGVSPVRATDD